MDLVKVEIADAGKTFAWRMACDQDSHSDRDMLTYLGRGDVPEPEVVAIMVRVVRPGDRVVDGGANVGFFTLLLSQLVGPAGRVYAFEPGLNNLSKLQLNLQVNAVDNVDVYMQPLWHEQTTVAFYNRIHGGFSSLFDDKYAVDAMTMPTFCLSLVPPPLRLIKLDIEGAELAALSAADIHLKNCACPFVICEMNEPALNELGATSQALFTMMRGYGYSVYALTQNSVPVFVPPSRHLVGSSNANVLFSTREALLSAGIATTTTSLTN